jgi:hypothetical protein
MNDHEQQQHQPEPTECPRTRLVRGSVAFVDACQCGMLQLHIGALTLRLAPEALFELADTLNRAAIAHARQFQGAEGAASALGLLRNERGDA